MKFEDRYASAIQASNLKSEEPTLFSGADVIGAAGFASKSRRASETPDARPGQPLPMALLRLFTGDNRAADEIIEILTAKVVGKAFRLGHEIGHPAASIIARMSLDWFRDSACKACGGHGYELIKGAPAIGEKACARCGGNKKRPFETMFPADRIDIARWLLADLEREINLAGPAAMAALAPRLDL